MCIFAGDSKGIKETINNLELTRDSITSAENNGILHY